jgi:hypothetical protein
MRILQFFLLLLLALDFERLSAMDKIPVKLTVEEQEKLDDDLRQAVDSKNESQIEPRSCFYAKISLNIVF